MPNGKSDIMAQAVYLAQLEAQKNSCKCTTCRILRKATTAMTKQFLGEAEEGNPGIQEVVQAASKQADAALNLGEEDD